MILDTLFEAGLLVLFIFTAIVPSSIVSAAACSMSASPGFEGVPIPLVASILRPLRRRGKRAKHPVFERCQREHVCGLRDASVLLPKTRSRLRRTSSSFFGSLSLRARSVTSGPDPLTRGGPFSLFFPSRALNVARFSPSFVRSNTSRSTPSILRVSALVTSH